MTLQYHIRSPSGMALRVRRQPEWQSQSLSSSNRLRKDTNLLFELLVNGIQGVLYCNTFQIPCGDLEAEREVQVDLLYGRCGEHLL